MSQQRDGPWWDRASALDKYDRISIPGFHIGGWYDGYRNSLPRMLQHVKGAPVKAMIGPWDHTFPHNAAPGPGMEWRHEAVRWFDHWLKGVDTGIMDEPPLAVYVREYHPPDPSIIDRTVDGKWRWEPDGWPIQRAVERTFYAQADHSLSLLEDGDDDEGEEKEEEGATAASSTAAGEVDSDAGAAAAAASAAAGETSRHELQYKASVGLEGGGPVMWWGTPGPDQQPMDDRALCYDSDPLTSAVEILGFPLARLCVSTDATRANWVVRLCDVAPDGRVTQVVGGACNGTHCNRGSARAPQYLVPGEELELEVQMHWYVSIL
jgi:putative CocE/NonD family hydrolase